MGFPAARNITVYTGNLRPVVQEGDNFRKRHVISRVEVSQNGFDDLQIFRHIDLNLEFRTTQVVWRFNIQEAVSTRILPDEKCAMFADRRIKRTFVRIQERRDREYLHLHSRRVGCSQVVADEIVASIGLSETVNAIVDYAGVYQRAIAEHLYAHIRVLRPQRPYHAIQDIVFASPVTRDATVSTV